MYSHNSRCDVTLPVMLTKRVEPTQYRLTVRADPADARVRLVNSSFTYRPGVLLPPGSYVVEVTGRGYETKRESVRISDGDVTLPVELEEAAGLDGCNYIQTLFRIIFPNSGPGIAVGAIFVFINSYNEFVVPLFLLSTASKYPLTLVMYSMLTDTTIRWHIMAASSLMGIVAPVLLFTFFQKYIITGVTSGAVKG